MVEKCENLDKCGFFLNYQGNTEVIKNGWIALYCGNRMRSERCRRKLIKRETGSSPAANMAPTGRVL